MNLERREKLKQLLWEAMRNLNIHYERNPSLLPLNVYQRYLQDRWESCGADFLSLSFSTYFAPEIMNKTTESKLLNCIREELTSFIDGDYIPTASYSIENNTTDGVHLSCRSFTRLHIRLFLQHLLNITIARGKDAAVSALETCSCPEGVSGIFQYVALLNGIKLEKESRIFEGVRLCPFPSTKTAEEVVLYLPGFPHRSFDDLAYSLERTTLLIVDRPGFSTFHKPLPNPILDKFPVADLPFELEVHDTKFSNLKEVYSFEDLFCQALSLACDSSLQITHKGEFLDENRTFNPNYGRLVRLNYLSPFTSSTEANEDQIGHAKHLYEVLANSDSSFTSKLQIPITRWMMSKANTNYVSQMIDLGIALESLYLSGISSKTELSFRFSLHAAFYLASDRKDRKRLLTEFKEIYTWRSKAVHSGELGREVKFGGKSVPTSEFIKRAQELCRQSIMKVLEDGRFPDWNDLILRGGIEIDIEHPGGL